MNDGKNRDWVETFIAFETWLKDKVIGDNPNSLPQWVIEKMATAFHAGRSHIPPQPPIAKDVKELAITICHRIADHDEETDSFDQCVKEVIRQIQSFLTAHSAKQNKETIRVLETITNVCCGEAQCKQSARIHLQKLKGEAQTK